LKGPAQPFPARHKRSKAGDLFSFEDDFSGIGPVVAYNAVKQGRFSRPIRADETNDFTLIDVERDVVIGYQSPKILDEIDDLKKGQA
jgi:hypothetical protein